MDHRTPSLEPLTLDRAATVMKCLGHPLRLRLLEALEDREQTVTELIQLCGVPQAVVSQQLGILRGRGVVEATRHGAFVHYAISEPRVHHILDCIRTCDGFRQQVSPAAVS